MVTLAAAFLWANLESIEDGGPLRIGLHITLWVGMIGLVFAFPNLTRKQGTFLICAAAILVRLAFWQAPVSDDLNRYLWEGSLIWKGENPYATVVDDERWIYLRDDIWKEINHRDRLTAYPPGIEFVMAGASWLWYDLQVFKVVALVGDLWILGILLLLSKDFSRPLRWLGFYAFNPIVLASFAAEAHFDSLMVGALITALLMAHRKRAGWAWFWLGAAIQLKIIAVVMVPYFLVRLGWKHLGPFLGILILPCFYFGEDFWNMLSGFVGFGWAGSFNGGLYEFLKMLGVTDGLIRLLTTALFAMLGLFYGWRALWGREKDLLLTSYVLMGGLIICSSVVHFWYLTWVIPFLVLRPSLSWLVLCLTTSIYFLAWNGVLSGEAWGYHRTWVLLTWLPFFAIFIWENHFLKNRLSTQPFSEAQTIDLVIPVYNAAEHLPSFLKKIQHASPEVQRIIVVDGYSTDDSREIALQFGCEVIQAPLGRGSQIAAGILKGDADLVAIIHSDTIPVDQWVPKLLASARMQTLSPAFALGQRFSGNPGLGLLMVEILNEARVLFSGSVFGDQTLIVRREALDQIGGFPKQPLMEDVEVSWRLMKIGPIHYLGEEWQVSPQKWNGRFHARFQQVISLMIRYRWYRSKGPDTAAEFSERLYQEYYQSKK